MGRGTQNVYPVWSPLGDIPFEIGGLAIWEKFGGKWATTEFEAGDVLIFGMFLLHCSLENTTNQYRLSVDARYQSANEAVDERWSGKKPRSHYK
ncbi:hypothetical protein [Paenibacillus ferrarius]|uniref:hypothetical protein n=1 Tax=Paenibacillus ferrarius TaxID=1469647 RepID=UPI003D28068B